MRNRSTDAAHRIADDPPLRSLRVGLLGCGNVGAPVAQALLEKEVFERVTRIPLELVSVAVAHPLKERPIELPPDILTNDALAVAIDPDIDIVVELIGGIEPPLSAIRAALADNKGVVTANKEVLALHGDELLADLDARLYFEASVGGAIPIVRALKESFAGDKIETITGILNGTCNFILSTMTRRGCSFEDALDEASRHGYAEPDPTHDIEGVDAAAKLAILARIAFDVPTSLHDVQREGIWGIDRKRILEARSESLVFKSICTARRSARGDIYLRIAPQLLRPEHPLANVNGGANAILVSARRAGDLAFYGQGGGGKATAAAVLGDLLDAARERARQQLPRSAFVVGC